MKCPKCGAEIAEEAAFCGKCGAKIEHEDAGVTDGVAPDATVEDSADVEVEDAPEEMPAEDPTDEKGEGEPEKQLSKNAKIAIAAVAVVLMVALGVFLFNQQQQKDFENDVEAQVLEEAKAEYEGQTELFAKNDYVEPSEYQVDSLVVSEFNESDGKVTGTATADVSNESFSTTVELNYAADVDGSRNVSNVTIEPTSTETTPLTGITTDEEHGIEDADSDLYDDNTCVVDYVDDSTANWVVTSGAKHELTYKFNGKKWKFKKDELSGDIEWGDFSGTYYPVDGSDSWLRMYSNTPGTVVCEWHGDYHITGSAGDVIQDLSGTVSATVGDVEIQDYGNGFYGFDFSDEHGYAANGLRGMAHFKLVFNPEQEGSLKLFKSEYQQQATEKYQQFIAIANFRHGSSVNNLRERSAGVIGIPDDFGGGQSSFNDTNFTYNRKDE